MMSSLYYVCRTLIRFGPILQNLPDIPFIKKKKKEEDHRKVVGILKCFGAKSATSKIYSTQTRFFFFLGIKRNSNKNFNLKIFCKCNLPIILTSV